MSELTKALVAARAEFPKITKGRTAKVPTKNGGEYSYTYADLADVEEAVTPALTKHGVFVHQPIDTDDEGRVYLLTRLACGEDESCYRWLLPLEALGPQAVGSLLTYYRRYALCAALGIVADDDDDGARANDVRTRQDDAPPTRAQSRPTRSEAPPARSSSAASNDAPSDAQKRMLDRCYKAIGLEPMYETAFHRDVAGRECTRDELTKREMSKVIDAAKKVEDGGPWPDGWRTNGDQAVNYAEGEEPW